MWRFLPLSGVVLLIAIALGLRPLLQFRRHGTFGIFLFRSGNAAQHVRDGLLIVLFACCWARPSSQRSRGSLDLLVAEHGPLHQALQIVGTVLMLCGIAFLAVAQLHLGASWRIGIDAGRQAGARHGRALPLLAQSHLPRLVDHRRGLRVPCSRPCCPPFC